MKIIILFSLFLASSSCARNPKKDSASTFLKSLGDWNYYKVPVTGIMTSMNVKAACEKAGLVAPCPGDSNCKFSSKECTDTGLPNKKGVCSGWYDLCGNRPPQTCVELRGVYMYYHGFYHGSACGVIEAAHFPFNCKRGIYYQNKAALCARKHKKSPLKEKLLKIESLLNAAKKKHLD